MTSLEMLREKRPAILNLARRHHAQNVQVFGSVVRQEDRSDSDIDLLVDPDDECSLLDHVALWQDLEDLIGRKVDVVSVRALHPLIRDRILKEAIPL